MISEYLSTRSSLVIARTLVPSFYLTRCLLADHDVTAVATGNAKIAGLVADLHLTGVQFNLRVAILLVRVCVLLL